MKAYNTSLLDYQWLLTVDSHNVENCNIIDDRRDDGYEYLGIFYNYSNFKFDVVMIKLIN